jgi:hypothetical protein
LSENHTRADTQALRVPYDAPTSVLHNLYCSMIDIHIRAESHDVVITFTIDKARLADKLPLKEGKRTRSILVVDYIAKRLDKTELERRYCNRFLTNFASCDRILANLQIWDDDKLVDTISVELTDTGYPSGSSLVKKLRPEFDGETLRKRHLSSVEGQ